MTVAVVTGGARGIGLAIAQRLAKDGASVAIGDIDEGLARSATEGIEGASGHYLDVADSGSFAKFLDEVERTFGSVDVLVNNAGIMPIGAFEDQSELLDRRAFDVNVFGTLNGIRAVLPRMLERGSGHIVNIASTAGKAAVPGGVLYAGTKHAIVGISEGIRQEYAARGIKASTILPSFTNTELISGTKGLRGVPTVQPSDVADAVADAIRKNRAVTYVPRSLKATMALNAVLPVAVNDFISRLYGADRVFLDFDKSTRRAYDRRIGNEG